MIVPMVRIRIGGSKSVLDQSVGELRKLGYLHIISSRMDKVLSESRFKVEMMQPGISEKLHKMGSLLENIISVLSLLCDGNLLQRGNSLPMPERDEWETDKLLDEIKNITATIKQIGEKQKLLEEEIREIGYYRKLFEEFQPLIETVEDLKNVEVSGLIIKEDADNPEKKLRLIEDVLDKISSGAYSIVRSVKENKGVSCLLVYPSSVSQAVREEVFGQEIRPVHVPEKYGKETFGSTLLNLFRQEGEVKRQLAKCVNELTDHSIRHASLLLEAKEWLSDEIRNLKVQNYLAFSNNTFWISGWVPESKKNEVENFITEKFEGSLVCYFQVPLSAEYADVPVLLANRPLAKPFERLLSIFSPPAYGSIDPTPFIAVFFPLFFGFMLGDVGYAGIIFLLILVIKRIKVDDPLLGDLTRILAFCAISSAFFGILFGEFFGKFWVELGLPEPFYDRKHEIVGFLVIALVLGGIHIFLGNILTLVVSIRKKQKSEVFKSLSNLVLIVSLYATIASLFLDWQVELPLFIFVLSVIGKSLFGGAKELLELFRILSNMLSYSRLMAIGIASVMLADLAGDFYLLSESVVIGIAGAVAVHAVNFILGLFAPTIQALRLHYVEFFSQFFIAGSARYEPFK